MPLDKDGRKERAKKAGKASGKVRLYANLARDNEIYRAYIYLSKELPQEKYDIPHARKFLEANNISETDQNLSICRKLADATGLTYQRVYQIIKKAKQKRKI